MELGKFSETRVNWNCRFTNKTTDAAQLLAHNTIQTNTSTDNSCNILYKIDFILFPML